MRISQIKFYYHNNLGSNNSVPSAISFSGNNKTDVFEQSPSTNNDYKNIILFLNLNGEKKFRYNKNILNEIQAKIIDKSVEIDKYEHSLGANLQKMAICHYLLNTMPEQSPYTISIIERHLLCKLKKTMSEQFEDNKIGAKVLISEDLDEQKNGLHNYYSILSSLYKNVSLRFAYSFLKPDIQKEINNLTTEDLELIIKNYYKLDTKFKKKFSYSITKIDSDKFLAEAKINENNLMYVTAKSPENCKRKLFEKILKLNNINLSSTNKTREVKRKYCFNSEAKHACESVLKEINFFNEHDKLDNFKDNYKIEYIYRAIDLSSRVTDPYRFQVLEFYGDTILNVLVGKFLLEKKISKEDKTHYYTIMQNNKTAARNAVNIGLYKHIRNTEGKEITIKTFADIFEAMIGALTLAYDEDVVYNYLKPIFEKNYKDIQEYHKLKGAMNYDSKN